MGTVKVTFTLDEATVKRIEAASQRLAMPKSQVVREAVQEYHQRLGHMSEQERKRMLAVFGEVIPRLPPRSPKEIRRELQQIRMARKGGGRKSIV